MNEIDLKFWHLLFLMAAFAICIVFLSDRKRKQALFLIIKHFKAKIFHTTIWFKYRDANFILHETTTHGVRSFSSFAQKPLRPPYSPLFDLYLQVSPNKANDFWIRQRGTGVISNAIASLDKSGRSLQYSGRNFDVISKGNLDHLENIFPSIADKFIKLMDPSCELGEIYTDTPILFYKGFWRRDYFIKIHGIPEQIHLDPAKLQSLLDTTLELSKELGFNRVVDRKA